MKNFKAIALTTIALLTIATTTTQDSTTLTGDAALGAPRVTFGAATR